MKSILDEIPVVDFEDIPVQVESAITAVAFSALIVVIGCENGSVFVYDTHLYQQIPTSLEKFRSRIISISIDETSRAFVVVSSHGQLAIIENPLTDAIVNVLDEVEHIHCPIYGGSICPRYSDSAQYRRVVLAGSTADLIVLSQQGSPFPSISLSKTGSRGPITSLVWQGEHLVWAGPEFGIKAINTVTSQKIVSISSSLARNIKVASAGGQSGFFVSWSGYTITLFQILLRGEAEVCEIKRKVELPVDQFAPDSEIGYLMGPDRHRLVSVRLFDASELSLTLITTTSSQVCLHVVDTTLRDIPISDLVCDSLSGSKIVVVGNLVVSNGERIVRITKRSVLANALWLIQKGCCEEALALSQIDPSCASFIASKALVPLIASGDFQRVAKVLSSLQLDTAAKWSEVIDVFISLPTGSGLKQSLDLLIPRIPVPPRDDLKLEQCDYDRVMETIVRNIRWSFLTLLEAVRRWPICIYNAHMIKDRLIDMVPEDFTLSKSQKSVFIPKTVALFPSGNTTDEQDEGVLTTVALMLSLHVVFEAMNRVADSLDTLIRLNCVQEVFIALNGCVESSSAVRSWFEINMMSLFQLDALGTAHFLIRKGSLFPYDFVIDELNPHPFFLHVFLREQFSHDPESTKELQNEQIALFVQFDKELLIPFLKSAPYYDPVGALISVSQQSPRLVEAEALLLYKTGRLKEAITLLLEGSADIKTAVSFAGEANDPELWSWVRSRVKTDEWKYGTQFLESIHEASRETFNFPNQFLPEDVLLETSDSPNIASVAGKILHVQKLSQLIESSCCRLLKAEWVHLRRANFSSLGETTYIDPFTDLCKVCGLKIASVPPGERISKIPSALVVVSGNDLVHSECLARTAMDNTYFPIDS